LQNKTNRSFQLSKSIGYTRVSTNEQAEEGISLEAQQERLHAYCILRGLELVQIVSDPGVSAGKPLVKREGGNYLLEQLAMGTVQHVIALKLDRLFRSVVDCLTTVEMWQQQGIGLHLLDMGGSAIDTSSAMGKMFLTMAAGFAEMERNLAGERTAIALARKKTKGEKWCARLPYGYEVGEDGNTLVTSKADTKLIARVKRLHKTGMSIRAIATKVTAEGYTSRTGAPVSKTTVGQLLRS